MIQHFKVFFEFELFTFKIINLISPLKKAIDLNIYPKFDYMYV